jgi:hypothetical protein
MINPLVQPFNETMNVEEMADHPRPWQISKRKILIFLLVGITCAAMVIMVFTNNVTRVFPEYDSPLDIPIKLAGNFGEVRNDHWHLGLDIRTNGKENLSVRSVADGWISRVTISATGYGNAIYITHDNNRTSLYAHLNSFSDPVAGYVAAIQQQTEQWSQDIRMPRGKFKVKQGAVIGLSGNTGFSEGPHLHFEWRNTATGTSINPLLEVFKVSDDLPPVIEDVYWYSRTPGSDQFIPQKLYSITSSNSMEERSDKTHLVSSRLVSLGLIVVDKISSSPFNMGVYNAKVLVDGKSIYAFKMDSLAAGNSLNVNSSIDYARWQHSADCILLLSDCKNIYSGKDRVNGDGIIDLGDGNAHNVRIETKDIAGNTSNHEFILKYRANKKVPETKPPNFFAGRKATIKTEDAVVTLPPGSFDKDVFFSVTQASASDKKGTSPVISLCQPNLPLKDSLKLTIRSRRRLSEVEKKHAVLVLRNGAAGFVYKGSWNGNWFETLIGKLGEAKIVIDLVPPVIKLSGWKNRQKIGRGDGLKMVINDNLEIIRDVRAELDGRWVPLDRKDQVYTLRMVNRTPAANLNSGGNITGGVHVLMIRVSDVAGNITRNVFRFQY